MATFSPGTTAHLPVSFIDAYGNPIDMDAVDVQIFDPNGLAVDMSAATMDHLGTGEYQENYPIAADALVGNWTIEWTGWLAGLAAPGDDEFGVQFSNVTVITSESALQSSLRARLGEVKRDPDGTGTETLFDDEQIANILSYASNDLDLATLEGWKRKAAHFSRLVDFSELGSDRNLRQKFTNAKMMIDTWTGIVNRGDQSRSDALAGRVVGRVASLRESPSDANLGLFAGRPVTSTRMYLTKRLIIPAILS